MIRTMRTLSLLTLWLFVTPSSWADQNGGVTHSDPVIPILLALTLIILAALMGREFAQRLGQPSVLGELIIGILIGNVGYWLGIELIVVLRDSAAIFNALQAASEQGIPLLESLSAQLDPIRAAELLPLLGCHYGNQMIDVIQVIDIFSRIGLLFLLFVVGLESSIHELRASIQSGLRVAALGVIAPFVLGYATMEILAPESDWSSALMVAIALCATSIGITAKVFLELKIERSHSAQIVLSAAIIDDVLGLLMLAIGIDIILRGNISSATILYSISQAVIFLVAIYLLVPILLRRVIRFFHTFELWEAELFVSFLLLTFLSWLADLVGLSAVVGAFAAGLILSNSAFTYWKRDCKPGEPCYLDQEIKHQIRPFEAILAPVFFVLMGTQVKLEAFMDQEVVLLASVLTVVAVIGKLVSGLGAPAHYPRLAIGAGMVPRGEVALILASLGKSIGVLDSTLFAAVVMMSIATTLIGPPILKWQLNKVKSLP